MKGDPDADDKNTKFTLNVYYDKFIFHEFNVHIRDYTVRIQIFRFCYNHKLYVAIQTPQEEHKIQISMYKNDKLVC
jgi:hypothetical protein